MEQLQVEKSHIKNFGIITLSWTCSSMAYYLVTFRITHLSGGSMMLNGFSVALAEFFANIVVGTFLAEIGLKATLIGSYLVAALASILYMFPVLTFGLWYAGILFFVKLGLTGSFAATFYGTNALFRPDLVPLVFAVANIFSRFWTALAPQISEG